MTFTYTLGTPPPTPKDAVRSMIGDVDPTDPLIQDEDINNVITVNPALTRAAAACCIMIIGRIARRGINKVIGKTTISANQMIDNYRKLYDMLMASSGDDMIGASANLVLYAGGISLAENQRIEADNDFIVPDVKIGADDLPGVIETTLTDDKNWGIP